MPNLIPQILDKKTSTTILDAGNFQAHGHGSNAKVLNYTGNFKVGAEGKSGQNCSPFGGNATVGSGNPANTTASSHLSWYYVAFQLHSKFCISI